MCRPAISVWPRARSVTCSVNTSASRTAMSPVCSPARGWCVGRCVRAHRGDRLYGAAYFAEEMLAARGEGLEGREVVVSGSGNVAIYAIQKVQALGGRVVACSDSGGYVFDPEAIDVELLRAIKEVERGRISDYAERCGNGTSYVADGSVCDVPCQVALPCATQNELDDGAAPQLVKSGVVAVAEGANIPCTPDAVRLFHDAGVMLARARQPTPAGSQQAPWRCSRAPRGTRGPSSIASNGCTASCATSTPCASTPPRTTAARATTCWE